MKKLWPLLTLAVFLSLGTLAEAASLSFDGLFTSDDQIQLVNFHLDASSTIALRTYSYAGGINAAGDTIARGGFDPVLSLFTGAGNFIGGSDDNDDDHNGDGLPDYPIVVQTDSVTGKAYDSYLEALLNPGDYIVAITQAENEFSGHGQVGANISMGFQQQGQGNYTPGIILSETGQVVTGPFWEENGTDSNGNYRIYQRDGHWAFDVLNINQNTIAVPEPATMGLLVFGLAGLFFKRKRTV